MVTGKHPNLFDFLLIIQNYLENNFMITLARTFSNSYKAYTENAAFMEFKYFSLNFKPE